MAQNVNPIDLGDKRELFVDSYLWDAVQSDHITHRLLVPRPAETVMEFDKPWEGRYVGYVTVFKDGEQFRMYYRGLPVDKGDGSSSESTCYAESTDAIHWTRPNLGLFEVSGTRENNVVLSGMEPLSHNFSPFKDTRPDVPAEERYKALAGTEKIGLMAFVSPDGIHWKKLQDAPVIEGAQFDSQNLAFWSASESCYVCYCRKWHAGWGGVRSVGRATSPDFVHWTAVDEMSFKDAPMEHLYTNQTTPYFRAPHLYISICARFMPGRRVVSPDQFEAIGGEKAYSGDCSDSVFMTSRGGMVYDRTFMEGFVKPGVGLNNWTSRTNYPAWGIIPTSEDEISFYVQRNYGQLSHHLQRMVLRTDGFACLTAPYQGGWFCTKPFTFTGKELELNVSTSAAGSVWVELQQADGTTIPGFTRDDADEIIGDAIARVATWKGNKDVSAWAGKPVRLRFEMKDADLYSLRFR